SWLAEGIAVKVVTQALPQYHRLKGRVLRVTHQGRGAEVEMLDSGDVLGLDCADLETVIPREGGQVRVLRGSRRGEVARVLELDTEHFCVRVRLRDGQERSYEYEHVSKVADEP
ncbi:hypothetical protein H632_c5180p0, partial [Helicosporidium sp. ATCC 50920]